MLEVTERRRLWESICVMLVLQEEGGQDSLFTFLPLSSPPTPQKSSPNSQPPKQNSDPIKRVWLTPDGKGRVPGERGGGGGGEQARPLLWRERGGERPLPPSLQGLQEGSPRPAPPHSLANLCRGAEKATLHRPLRFARHGRQAGSRLSSSSSPSKLRRWRERSGSQQEGGGAMAGQGGWGALPWRASGVEGERLLSLLCRGGVPHWWEGKRRAGGREASGRCKGRGGGLGAPGHKAKEGGLERSPGGEGRPWTVRS